MSLREWGLSSSRDVLGDHCAGGSAGHVQEMHLRAHPSPGALVRNCSCPGFFCLQTAAATLGFFHCPRVCSEEKPPQRAAGKDLVLPSRVS